MYRFGGPCLSLGILVIVSGSAWGQDLEAAEWIARSNQAVEQLNYRGRYVHRQGETFETLFIVHAYDAGHVSERLLSLDGAGREIIRDGDVVQCILPDRETVLLENGSDTSPLAGLPNYSEALAAHYEFSLEETARIAGRRTQVVSIMPRDEMRYGYRLWLDFETKMPLRSELVDEHGATVEQVFFTDIEISVPISPSELEPTINFEGFTLQSDRPPASMASTSDLDKFVVSELPPGFRLSAASKSPMAGSRYPVDHLVYTDGLATVSVFVEDPKSSPEINPGYSRLGTANAFSTSIAGHRVTAVGEVPRQTVETIARSLRGE
jgi:sigma-E factor negative regulatory protein RseB